MADTPPRTLEEALTRARHHTRRAAQEGVHAARAVVDAAALAAGGGAASGRPAFRGLLAAIDEVAGALDGGAMASPIFDALHDALDNEVRRWEQRAQIDPDARAVLRAFLGVREILWELGIRRPTRAGSRSRRATRTAESTNSPSSGRGPGAGQERPPDVGVRAAGSDGTNGSSARRSDDAPASDPRREGRRVQRIELDP